MKILREILIYCVFFFQTFKQAQKIAAKSIINEGSIEQEPLNKKSSANVDNYGTIAAVGDYSLVTETCFWDII